MYRCGLGSCHKAEEREDQGGDGGGRVLKIIHRGVGFCELLMVGRLFYQWSDSTYCNSISTFL